MTTTTLAGAFTNRPSQNLAGDKAYLQRFPYTEIFRHFSSSLPSNIENVAETKGAQAAGIGLFLSVHTDHNKPEAQEALISSLAKSMRPGNILANWHEPEAPKKNFTPAQYVAMNRKFYTMVKKANPGLICIPVHMEYQMRPGGRGLPLDDWYVGQGYCDGIGLDVYCNTWNKQKDGSPIPLEQLPGFAEWWPWAVKTGKPLYIAELGCAAVDENRKQSFTDQQRADWYGHAIDWLTAHGVALISPWNGEGAPGGDQFWYWGGSIDFPLTAAAIAKRVVPPTPTPAPANPTPWAVPITPDPTARIEAAQTRSGTIGDGLFGEKSLKAWEDVLAERDILRAKVAAGMAALQ